MEPCKFVPIATHVPLPKLRPFSKFEKKANVALEGFIKIKLNYTYLSTKWSLSSGPDRTEEKVEPRGIPVQKLHPQIARESTRSHTEDLCLYNLGLQTRVQEFQHSRN